MTTYTASLDSFKAILLLSATPPLAGSYLGGRISAPYVGAAGPSTSRPYILPLDRRRAGRRCTCVGFLSRGRSMEVLKRSVLASDLGAGGEVCRSRPPLRARSEEGGLDLSPIVHVVSAMLSGNDNFLAGLRLWLSISAIDNKNPWPKEFLILFISHMQLRNLTLHCPIENWRAAINIVLRRMGVKSNLLLIG
ncbi:hypothetical protein IEQ34_015167 [Dendrobium chrysotoxum]|uniref:Uncharacterized protein n=1 Tax=Dendrobium chrysotoxum TaxID=161865 RepID=A0AAV7G5V7_DENCH|nr:hypothetical protein IEQ34_015167 [Dendrobium chrysotoxum]